MPLLRSRSPVAALMPPTAEAAISRDDAQAALRRRTSADRAWLLRADRGCLVVAVFGSRGFWFVDPEVTV
jgi:hypothetical protein